MVNTRRQIIASMEATIVEKVSTKTASLLQELCADRSANHVIKINKYLNDIAKSVIGKDEQDEIDLLVKIYQKFLNATSAKMQETLFNEFSNPELAKQKAEKARAQRNKNITAQPVENSLDPEEVF